ncbi:MAG TPA: deoxyribonuclease IV [Candidatus Limnocylindria bacterium]|nr:deoxyribonuclease IV [Candidatus Limnocylindria bacterium]
MLTTNQPLLIGGHMSTAGGLEQSLIQGNSIGVRVIQLFTKSNRQWMAKPITTQEADLFKATAAQLNINSIVVHACYLINLGSPDPVTNKKSVAAVIDELERCHQLGINLLVLHPGSHLATNVDSCLQKIAENLNYIFEQTSHISTMILLENMAGQGSTVCSKFEHIATIINAIQQKQRIGVCFDTCHAFAAGYTFNTEQTYYALWQDFDRIIGLSYLKAFHINDSKKECASRVDRHAEIGEGFIGFQAFKFLCKDQRFFAVPKILETPLGFPEYSHNIAVLKKLITEE